MALDTVLAQEQVEEQDQGLYDWIAEQEEGPVMWGMFQDFSKGAEVKVLETQHCPPCYSSMPWVIMSTNLVIWYWCLSTKCQ